MTALQSPDIRYFHKNLVLRSDSTIVMLQLASVNISWCEMMTAAGVAALAEGCQHLNTFIAKVGPSLSPPSVNSYNHP